MVHGPPESILGVSYPGRWLRRGHQLASQSALNHNPHRRAVSPGKPKSGASMANPDPPLKMKRNIAFLALCQAVCNTSTGVVLSVSALVGLALASNNSLATLPQALQWEATAALIPGR